MSQLINWPLRKATRIKRLVVHRRIAALEKKVLASQWLNEDMIRELQLTQVRRLLRHAYKTTRYYRELFDRIGGYGDNLRAGYEDWDFWLGALECGAKFTHVPEELFRYRRHGSTMLTGADRLALHLRATIVTNHKSLYPRWRVRIAERMLGAGDRPGLLVRLGMLTTLLFDRRLKLFWRQLTSLRATNMLST